MDGAFLRCSHCGDRIGVYERIWVRHRDGTLEESSFLNIRDRALPIQLFHLGCLAPDTADDA